MSGVSGGRVWVIKQKYRRRTHSTPDGDERTWAAHGAAIVLLPEPP